MPEASTFGVGGCASTSVNAYVERVFAQLHAMLCHKFEIEKLNEQSLSIGEYLLVVGRKPDKKHHLLPFLLFTKGEIVLRAFHPLPIALYLLT